MKVSRYTLLVFFISLILFLIPFLWLKPGEMDIGGDSSRLYFYDPLGYLPNQSLYSVTISALGWENLSFFGMPFFLFLALLKLFFTTPTLLISGFHGLSLCLSFIFIYLIVKEILQNTNQIKKNKNVVVWSSIIAGIIYVFSPAEIYDWGYVILTHNQIFLNPLVFYLLLKFFTKNNEKYLYVALIISFIFAPNFSFIGAPPFFAFYPLSFVFLFIYTKFVRNLNIPFKKMFLGLALFILIQIFHLAPQALTSLVPGGHLYNLVTSTAGKLDRGLGYFNSLAPSIKVSTDLLGLPELSVLANYDFLFFIFPIIFFSAFLFNKSKEYLATAAIFFIYLLFTAANITSLWLNTYKNMFYLPGFSMFRNFYGQWSYAFLFYFTLLLGQALAVVLILIKKNPFKYILSAFLLLLLTLNAVPFITGALIHKIHWTSNNVKTIFTMDPEYQKFLDIIKKLPVDGKILTLPINDHGYQIIADNNGGAYQGPSTIAYLTGKKDFSGYEVLGDFGPTFLRMVQNNDYSGLKHLFALLNIKYIFYNSDSKIYSDYFPNFPYGYVYKIMPATQKEYKDFINKLGVTEKINIANKYYIYEINDNEYLPFIYTSENIWDWNQGVFDNLYPISLFENYDRMVFYSQELNREKINENIITPLTSTRSFPDYYQIQDDLKLLSVPFISQRLSSPIYPAVVWREQRTLNKMKAVDQVYIDQSIYFLDKRILELEKWEGEGIPLIGNVKSIEDFARTWTDLSPWKIYTNNPYNYWEVSLARYEKAVNLLINKINNENQSGKDPLVIKTELNEIIKKHHNKLIRIVQESQFKTISQQKYLIGLIHNMYNRIDKSLGLSEVSSDSTIYNASNLTKGNYTPLVYKNDIKNFDPAKISLQIGGENITAKTTQSMSNWLEFNPIAINNIPQNVSLSVSDNQNLVNASSFQTLNNAENKNGLINFNLNTSYVDGTSGLIWEINGWYPKTQYVLSFDYLTNGKNYDVRVYEREGKSKSQIKILDDTINSQDWKTYKREIGLTITDPSNYAYSAYLHIDKGADDLLALSNGSLNSETLSLRNLSVKQIINPNLVFEKSIKENSQNYPKIVFTKINPTKYKVDITNATSPYMLVLSDDFNKNWKLIDISSPDHSLGGLFLRAIAKILSSTFGRFLPQENLHTKTVVSYFNGEITQKEYNDQFLNRNSFATWGKRIVADDRHVFSNNYSNAWYIKPSDMNGRKEYSLIIEMTTQTDFYISLLISLLSIVLIIGLFIFSFRKFKK